MGEMISMSEDMTPEVVQADRDAAADYILIWAGQSTGVAYVREGKSDNSPLVQAFARHRIAHSPAQASAVDAAPQSTLVDGVEARVRLTMPNGDVLTSDYPSDDNWARSWTTRDTQGRMATQEQDWEIVESYGLTKLFTAYRAALTPDATQTREANEVETVAMLSGAVRRILARCEAVKDENSDQLGKDQTEASSGFLRGERSLAKSIRRELHDLTRAALSAGGAK